MSISASLPQLPMKIGPRLPTLCLIIFIPIVLLVIASMVDWFPKLKSYAIMFFVCGVVVFILQRSERIGPFLIVDDDGLILSGLWSESRDMRILWSDIATIEPSIWSPGFGAYKLPLMVSTAEITFVPGTEWTERKADLGWLAAKIGVTIYPTQMPADELIKMLQDLKAAKASGVTASTVGTPDDATGAGA